MTQKTCSLLFILITAVLGQVHGQKNERVTPQVLSTTILIDQNTDVENLREQLLRTYKNTSITNVQEIRAWQELAVSLKNVLDKLNVTIDNKSGLLNISGKGVSNNDTTFFQIQLDQYPYSFVSLVSSLCDSLKTGIQNEIKTRLKDDDIEHTVEAKLDTLVNALQRLSIQIEKAIPANFNPIVTQLWKDIKNTSDDSKEFLISKVSELLIFIGSTYGDPETIDEVKRLAGLAEIFNEFQRVLTNAKSEIRNNKLVLIYNNDTVSITLNSNLIVMDVFNGLTESLYLMIRKDIMERLSKDHPAVENFDLLYSRILRTLNQLKVKAELNNKIIHLSLNDLNNDGRILKKIYDSTKSFVRLTKSNLKVGKPDFEQMLSKADTLLAHTIASEDSARIDIVKRGFKKLVPIVKTFRETINGWKSEKTESDKFLYETELITDILISSIEAIQKDLAEEVLLRPLLDFTINTVLPKLREGLTSRGKFEFLSHFGIGNNPEVGTVLVFKIDNGTSSRLEFFTNFFVNKADTNITGKNFIIGVDFKGSNKICEVGCYVSTTFSAATDLFTLNKSSSSKFIRPGFYMAFNCSKIITRPYFENTIQTSPRKIRWTGGFEFRFRQARYVSGVFLQGSNVLEGKPRLSFGITFPAIN